MCANGALLAALAGLAVNGLFAILAVALSLIDRRRGIKRMNRTRRAE